MKITCCCFTCIVGQNDNENNKEETSQLLQGDNESEEHSTPRDKQPYSRSASGISSASTLRGFSTESGDPTSESFDGNAPPSGAKFSKAVGVLKKYNVMSSRYNSKELQRQLSTPTKLSLKIGIKIMPRSSTVKISVIEAHGVTEALQAKGLPEITSSDEQEPSTIVQIRTKLMHNEVRGHTKKYEIQGGITGALKLRNETIHTVDLEEFLHCKLRFRLYFVLKHQRDKLLGEYTLDVESLNLDTNNAITHTMLELYDPALLESNIVSPTPQVTPVPPRFSSSDSQPSMDKDSLPPIPKIQRQAKIRSQDSDLRVSIKRDQDRASSDDSHSNEKSAESTTPTKKPLTKALKSIRHGASLMLTREPSKDKDRSLDAEHPSPSTEPLTANERLKMVLKERGEKVGELEDATAAMAESAGNFSALSVKLKEKYKAESKKKKSSES
uniref:uncharacterized protein LOC120327488 n=1 Tax=Styela clava TaxID=7725 RepID=UPI00193A4E4F|nr:uncharacterized protein LOC120327488 [Styela clava]